MATPNYGLTDYDAESQDIERRRKYAELLSQQSMQPIEQQTAGGWVTPISWTQGLAKALQGVSGSMGQAQANQQQRSLADRMDADRQQTLAKALRMAQGGPGTPDEEQGIYGGPGMAAQAPDRQGAAMLLAGSKVPDLRALAGPALKNMLTPFDPNSHLAHLDPAKFTTESWAEYLKSGGDTSKLRATASPNALLSNEMDQRKLALKWYEFNNLSAADREKYNAEAAKQGMNGFELFFKTGTQMPTYQPGPAVNGPANTAPMPFGPQVPQGAAAPQPVAPSPQGQTPIVQANGGKFLAPIDGMVPPEEMPAFVAAAQRPLDAGAVRPGSVPIARPGAPLVPNRPQIAPQEQQKLAVEQPQAQAALRGTNEFLDRMNNVISSLESSPGLSRILGPVAGRTPNITPDATNAQALLNTLKNQIGIGQLQAMREQSKTGGAVGNVTEKEWPILQNAISALEQSQTPEQFVANLQDVKQHISRIRQIASRKYQETYGQENAGGPRTRESILREYGLEPR